MTIRSELLALQATADEGILHPRTVVEWARDNPSSALHAALEWDDAKAADEYRVWQVRHLIKLNIQQEDGSPVFVSLSIDRATGGGYRAVSDVAAAPDLRAIMLRDALAELDRVRTKYDALTALSEVWEAADRASAKAGIKRRAASKPQEHATA